MGVNGAEGEIQAGEPVLEHKVADSIYLCPDGMYRWVYEFNMLKNPTLLFTIWKLVAFAFFLVYCFVLFVCLVTDSFYGMETFLPLTKVFSILILVFLGIGSLAYLILSGIYGGKYCVIFEMDEKGINHKQMDQQLEKSQALGWLTTLAGAASGNLTVMGTGMLAATRSSLYSDFSTVRRVKPNRMLHVIRVNGLLVHNQVYAEGEDFDFVLDYIRQHTGK